VLCLNLIVIQLFRKLAHHVIAPAQSSRGFKRYSRLYSCVRGNRYPTFRNLDAVVTESPMHSCPRRVRTRAGSLDSVIRGGQLEGYSIRQIA
jgi:hypothetical protein